MTGTTDRDPLTAERILEAAIALADDHGIEALSMRRLAASLGVEAMSIYHHIPSKAALVDAMADRVLGEIDLPEDRDWRDAVRGCALSAHEVLIAHPWASWLAMAPAAPGSPQPARTRYMEWLLGLLADAGFDDEMVFRGYHAIDAHILGFTAWHLGHSSGARAALAGRDLKEFVDEFFTNQGKDLPQLADHARLHVEHGSGDGDRDFVFGLDLIIEGLERRKG